MHHKKLIWQIFPSSLVVILAAITVVTWYGSSSLQSFYYEQMGSALEDRASLIKDRVSQLMFSDKIDDLRAFSRKVGRQASTRITVIDLDGKVVADSNEDPATMDLHGTRPEILEAYGGKTGISIRFSRTLQEKLMYVAIPLKWSQNGVFPDKTAENVKAVLRMSVSVTAIDKTLRNVQVKIALGAIVVVCLAALVTLFVSRRISRPLEEMTQSAERFSQGDFSHSMSLSQSASASIEVAALAASMDRMGKQLDDRIKTIVSQRNALEAVFSSMIESVLAVDTEERVMSINSSCARLFNVDQQKVQGRMIQEVVRNIKLQEQIQQVLKNQVPLESEIVQQEAQGDLFLQTHAVPLNDGSEKNIGVLVVMNDVTRIRRLENVRRDFVANVSHELKTPITSIKGYVETLLDGAMDNKEDASHFLKVVVKQTDRLHAIIEDLLSLSRIEKEAEEGEVVLAAGKVHQVLDAVVEACQLKAAEKNITISCNCPPELQANMNTTLLEQAVVNLVVNAIKYSDDESDVSVRAEEGAEADGTKQVIISVEDSGVGIAQKHLPRLFERFYRSDQARSRKLGGTGLGLAIVKHIVQAHGGDVSVQSQEGKGTSFFIILPGI